MTHSLYRKNIISISDLSQLELRHIMDTAAYFKNTPPVNLLKHTVIASCFFEASTRTRLSFEAAIHRLGASVVGFSDDQFTSVSKGESLSDTLRVISSYVDAIIIRHPKEGAPQYAAGFCPVPIINAGDGTNEHPTQTLLDLFSIQETQGRLSHLKIGLAGDLKYGRTVHSLTKALSIFPNNEFFLISPLELSMPCPLVKELNHSVHHTIEEVLPQLDILYMTRIQQERLKPEHRHLKTAFILEGKHLLPGQVKTNLKILHPLPRVDEIAPEVDTTPYAYYFQQAANGMFIREALLALLLNPHAPYP
ncbi:MAG: aspartate carbamoyltransferase [Candidatus Hamiltonella defensa (Ceratovacuna japonica)]